MNDEFAHSASDRTTCGCERARRARHGGHGFASERRRKGGGLPLWAAAGCAVAYTGALVGGGTLRLIDRDVT
jgi:hypothetical protein